MKTRTVFVAFLSVRDGRHDAFLDWHELDHRPENQGVIPHIFHSERFVATPDSLAHRVTSPDAPFADPGQYVVTYWSTEEPAKVTYDMAVLRQQLAAQGRCHPINRDFNAPWRERMYLAAAWANPAHNVSADAAPLTNHSQLVVTVGRYSDDPQWQQWYGVDGVASVFADRRVTAAYTLMPDWTQPDLPFVHLHYALPDGDGAPVQQTVADAYANGPGARPGLSFQGTYLAQHAAQPRFYT